MSDTNGFEPRIVAFLCNWCTYTGADLAGTSRLQYPPNVRIIRTMCSGAVDPVYALKPLLDGVDGVLIGGCHPGDCHYQEGNYKCLRRFELLKRLLGQMGVEPERVRLEWISASAGRIKFLNKAYCGSDCTDVGQGCLGYLFISGGEVPAFVNVSDDDFTDAPDLFSGV